MKINIIKINYFLPNFLKRKTNRRLFKQTILNFNAYLVSHIFSLKNGILDQ